MAKYKIFKKTLNIHGGIIECGVHQRGSLIIWIVFDELYNQDWLRETQALIDTIGINNLKIERFSFHPHISYAVL